MSDAETRRPQYRCGSAGGSRSRAILVPLTSRQRQGPRQIQDSIGASCYAALLFIMLGAGISCTSMPNGFRDPVNPADAQRTQTEGRPRAISTRECSRPPPMGCGSSSETPSTAWPSTSGDPAPGAFEAQQSAPPLLGWTLGAPGRPRHPKSHVTPRPARCRRPHFRRVRIDHGSPWAASSKATGRRPHPRARCGCSAMISSGVLELRRIPSAEAGRDQHRRPRRRVWSIPTDRGWRHACPSATEIAQRSAAPARVDKKC